MVYGLLVSRTNIDLNDSAVEIIMRRYGLRTKTEAVDYALRALAGQPLTREEILAMHGANGIGEIPEDIGP
jgi:Arc/MetJ family transcription regulator